MGPVLLVQVVVDGKRREGAARERHHPSPSGRYIVTVINQLGFLGSVLLAHCPTVDISFIRGFSCSTGALPCVTHRDSS